MIELSLIRDRTHYEKEQLDTMYGVFAKSFITHENPDLEKGFNPVSPEIRIHIKLTKGLIPEVLFMALGEDLCDFITNRDFFYAFSNPISDDIPSLVFDFVGESKSFEFKITSKSEKSLEEGSQKVMKKLLSVITQEGLLIDPVERYRFLYDNGDWTEVK
ncbi:MAG TPA: hypothetical protein VNK81_05345 [Thermodesulfobacteriota bacterium]|jgi:hypothetical protein|nr:hypothetical protein [Thermodesulfobacteriota bacterium]